MLVLEDLGSAPRLEQVLLRRARASRPRGRRGARHVPRGRARRHRRPPGSRRALRQRRHAPPARRPHLRAPVLGERFHAELGAARARRQRSGATRRRARSRRRPTRYLRAAGRARPRRRAGRQRAADAAGPQLLDAEIAHVGDPAFDVGILLAHLAVGSAARRRACGGGSGRRREAGLPTREPRPGAAPAFERAIRFAGIELVRRTLGAARLEAVTEDAAGLSVLELGLLAEAPAELRGSAF